MADQGPADGSRRRLVRRGFARVVVALSWLVVAAWLVGAGAAILRLPSLTATAGGGGLQSFVPDDSPTLRVQQRAAQEFRVPMLPQTVVVQRDAEGLAPRTQLEVVRAAVDVDLHHPADLAGIAGAVPILNTAGALPFSRERSTTAVTYLAFDPGVSLADRQDLSHRYAAHYFGDLPDDGAVVGATGASMGQLVRGRVIMDRLTWVEVAAILAVVLVVGWEFRSLLAPAVILAAAVVSYVVATRVVAWGGQQWDIAVPSELEPLLVVLLLGVVTDYSVFFLNGVRGRLRAGDEPKAAVRHAVVANVAWVIGAGLAVAAGTAVLLIARLGIFHALGPGMAVTVLLALAVSVTLVPALLAVLGRAVFWPRIPRPREDVDEPVSRPRAGLLRFVTMRPVAGVVVLLIVVGLGAAAWQVRGLSLGVSAMTGLPADAEPSRAQAAAAAGFAPGVVAPTTAVVHGTQVTTRSDALARLEQLISRQPGVAGVLGPASLPLSRQAGVFVAEDQDAARFAVVLDSPPLTDNAIDDVSRLRDRLPALAHRAGLEGVSTGVAGDTALAADIVETTRADMIRVGGLALLVELMILLVFLRSVLAPLYLLLADALALAATLGITTVVLGEVMEYPQFAVYVPFAVVVLLISFGSDYEIFLVGRIWDTAAARSLRGAVVDSGARAARAITIAGLALASSFGTLALVPLDSFRGFALAMVIGVLLDVLLVRPLLVPALITLFGRAGAWPRRLGQPAASSYGSQNGDRNRSPTRSLRS